MAKYNENKPIHTGDPLIEAKRYCIGHRAIWMALLLDEVRKAGGDMEKVISKTADILTDKISIEKEIRAIISQKQVEAKIITVMPLVILAGLNITSSGYIDPLYETIAGRIIMTVSLAGIIFAYDLTEKITDIKV